MTYINEDCWRLIKQYVGIYNDYPVGLVKKCLKLDSNKLRYFCVRLLKAYPKDSWSRKESKIYSLNFIFNQVKFLPNKINIYHSFNSMIDEYYLELKLKSVLKKLKKNLILF